MVQDVFYAGEASLGADRIIPYSKSEGGLRRSGVDPFAPSDQVIHRIGAGQSANNRRDIRSTDSSTQPGAPFNGGIRSTGTSLQTGVFFYPFFLMRRITPPTAGHPHSNLPREESMEKRGGSALNGRRLVWGNSDQCWKNLIQMKRMSCTIRTKMRIL